MRSSPVVTPKMRGWKRRTLRIASSSTRLSRPEGGAALLYANNNFLANKSGYGLEAQEIAIIVVLRHLATPFAFTDAIWAKYGEALSEIIEFQEPGRRSPRQRSTSTTPARPGCR
jgi:hypothetical protein